MRARLRVCAALIGLLAWLPCVPAEAQRAEARARALFEHAVDELHAGHFAEARDLFSASLELSPNAGTAFDLAIACRGTGEVLRAESLLQELLAGTHGELAAEQRAEVRRVLAEVTREVGSLTVVARGAARIEIRVDGRLVGEIDDGASLDVRVDPGERLVVASATDRETTEAPTTVARGGHERVSIELTATAEASVGTIILEAEEPSLVVEIVGVASATGRLQREVPPGDYQIRVSSPTGARETHLTVAPRSTTRLHLQAPGATSLADEPVFWIVLSASILAVAGAAIGIGLAVSPPRDPFVTDPDIPIVMALELGP